MKKQVKLIAVILLALMILAFFWNKLASPTKIAFVNYQIIELGQISQANDQKMIKISSLKTEEIEKINKYDVAVIYGMGLHITEAQRELVEKYAEKGLPVVTLMATNPANNITSLDSLEVATLKEYSSNAGRDNYRNMLLYLRKKIDKKKIFVTSPDAPIERVGGPFFHEDLEDEYGETIYFETLDDYISYLKDHNLYNSSAKNVIVTGMMGVPLPLMKKLEETGNNVFGVSSLKSAVKSGLLDQLAPNAVIHLAHGRFGDSVVDYLAEKNIPLFAPLNANTMVDTWRQDKMGMSGGFLSQSVVMPEIDGAIRPYVIFGHYLDENGVPYADAIPERLEKFVKTVNNYTSLQSKSNKDKKIAIVYYKGPGLSTLTAAGMDVASSMYNVLRKLKSEGYSVDLPANLNLLKKKINDLELEEGVVPNIQLGNIALLPQLAPSGQGATFATVHGVKKAPPASYINEYMWIQNEFEADAIMHFGTHGSLEFTPSKQVALCESDWPEKLIGELPHYYLYCIDNPGEGIIAKRRSYGGLQSYLTAPFMGTGLKGQFKKLHDAIHRYNHVQSEENAKAATKLADEITKLSNKMGINRDLGLPDVEIYSDDDICRIENFIEELASTQVTGNLYTMGVQYEPKRIETTVLAMSAEPIAYSLMALDKIRGEVPANFEEHRQQFTRRYLDPSRALVKVLLKRGFRNKASNANSNSDVNLSNLVSDKEICRIANISEGELLAARHMEEVRNQPQDMMSVMRRMSAKKGGMGGHPGSKSMGGHPGGKSMGGHPGSKSMGGHPGSKSMGGHPGGKKKPTGMDANTGSSLDENQIKAKKLQEKKYEAILEIANTIKNVNVYRQQLLSSPQAELESLANALSGGYTRPCPGGDPVATLNVLPTGRNIYGINADATPTEKAWEAGKQLAENTISMYKKRHDGAYPRKVSYTLWSSEFIQTEGASVAQILYMLGVEPIRDMFGRVNDIRLIPSEELGRPRIDVVVQTSGQLRDIAASRLFLVNRAVEMAAKAKDDKFENMVVEGVKESERTLVEEGISPKEAREIATYRIFGAADGGYGTGIQGMVQSGDKWDSEDEIARVYMNNMGGFYGSKENWESVRKSAFKAALTRTDVVTQPRQSNTWGALSLDHVYEFMGGINLAVRNVTGTDPDAYLSDYRNRHHARMQELKEAVGVESRTTILNENFIKERMKGDGESVNVFMEMVENTYGWNVMKPKVVDKELWDEIHDVFVRDKFNLNIDEYFDEKNPGAIQQMTAVMLETARKGLWKADPERIAELAELHAELVKKHGLSASSMDDQNLKLRDYITDNLDKKTAKEYTKVAEGAEYKEVDDEKSMVMKKESLSQNQESESLSISSIAVSGIVTILIIGVIIMVIRRRKRLQN